MFAPANALRVHSNVYPGSIKWFLRPVSAPFIWAAGGGDVTCPPEHGSVPGSGGTFTGIECVKNGIKIHGNEVQHEGLLIGDVRADVRPPDMRRPDEGRLTPSSRTLNNTN